MSTTLQTPSAPRIQAPTPVPSSTPTTTSHTTAWIVAGLVALVLIAGAVVLALHPWSTTTTAGPAQVPTVSAQELYGTSYGPGSALYNEQVPAAAASWTDGYGPGSTVYSEQVPPWIPPWTSFYGPGSAVYDEQVPAQAS